MEMDLKFLKETTLLTERLLFHERLEHSDYGLSLRVHEPSGYRRRRFVYSQSFSFVGKSVALLVTMNRFLFPRF